MPKRGTVRDRILRSDANGRHLVQRTIDSGWQRLRGKALQKSGPEAAYLHFYARYGGGVTQQLFSEGEKALSPDRVRKDYFFQVPNNDGLEHFRTLSQLYPALAFILVYGWDERSYGSHLISRGRARTYAVPDHLVEAVLAKHGLDNVPDDITDEEFPYDAEGHAERELMDFAEAHWQADLLKPG
jgi:hypothetical protein